MNRFYFTASAWFTGIKRLVLLFVVLFFVLSFYTATAQIVRDGSFENNTERGNPSIRIYPASLSSEYMAEVNHCLGQCRYQNYNGSFFGYWCPPLEPLGWFSATNATPDYFHRWTPDDINSPVDISIPTLRLAMIDYNDVPNRQVKYMNEIREPLLNCGVDTPYKAFCGLAYESWAYGKHMYWKSWGEYIESKLDMELLPNKAYKVSFYVSSSKLNTILGYYSKSFGAYLTKDPIVIPYSQGTTNLVEAIFDYTPFMLSFKQEHFIENKNLIRQHADETGCNGWYKVEGIIRPSETLRYITIGIFKTSEGLYNDFQRDPSLPAITKPDYIMTYYFVDDVEIQELDQNTCYCEDYAYYTNIEPMENQSDTGNCCYTIEVSLRTTTGHDCILGGINVYNMATGQIVFNKNGLIYQSLNESFCIDKDNLSDGGKTANFRVEYLNISGVPIDGCSKTFSIACRCLCTDGVNDALKIRAEKDDSESCCYDIWLDNTTTNCHADDLKYIVLKEATNRELTWEFTGSDWETYNYPGTTNHWRGWKRPDNTTIFPGQEVYIGKVCVEPTTEQTTFPIELITSSKAPDDTGIEPCTDNFSQVLYCDPEPQSCCESISAEFLKPLQGNVYSPECCYWLSIYLDAFISCKIKEIHVYKTGDPSSGRIFTGSPYIDLSSKGLILGKFCSSIVNSSNGRNVSIVSLTVDFYDENGNIICTKSMIDSCVSGPVGPGMGRINSDEPLDNYIDITENPIICVPSQTGNKTNIIFNLENSGNVEIELYDELGNRITGILSEEMNKGTHIHEFMTDKLPSGLYFVRMKNSDGAFTAKLNIIR